MFRIVPYAIIGVEINIRLDLIPNVCIIIPAELSTVDNDFEGLFEAVQ